MERIVVVLSGTFLHCDRNRPLHYGPDDCIVVTTLAEVSAAQARLKQVYDIA